MRAKNEYKFLAEAYDKKLLKEFYKMRDPDGDGSWPDDDDDRDHPDYGEPEYDDRGTGEIGGEDEEKRLRATNVQQMQIIHNDIKNLKISAEEAIRRTNFDPAYHKDLLRRYKKWAEREASFKDIKPASWFKTPELKEPSLNEILGLEETDEQIRRRGGHGDKDQPLWKRQMDNQPPVSPEEVERLKNKPRPKKTGRLTQPKREDNEEIDIGTMVTWNQDGPMKGEVVDVDIEQGFAVVETGFGSPAEKYVVDLGELTKAIPRAPREDNEEPRRGISGYEHKPDALVSARQAGAKHKPYVSSFVGDGGKKIFAILGSDGKIVHKTHNKQEAHQWLKDNYENI